MSEVFTIAIGLAVGVISGVIAHRPIVKPCKFCGYSDDQTEELFEAKELKKILGEEGE